MEYRPETEFRPDNTHREVCYYSFTRRRRRNTNGFLVLISAFVSPQEELRYRLIRHTRPPYRHSPVGNYIRMTRHTVIGALKSFSTQ